MTYLILMSIKISNNFAGYTHVITKSIHGVMAFLSATNRTESQDDASKALNL